MYYRGAQAAIIVYDITSQVLHTEIAGSELINWFDLGLATQGPDFQRFLSLF